MMRTATSVVRGALATLRHRGGFPSCAAFATQSGSHSISLPAFPLERGGSLDFQLAYKTYGSPGKPCIVHPTSFDAKDAELEYALGPGKVLDTDKYFVVIPNMVGNGLSTSPSTVAPQHRHTFPLVTVGDNHHLLTRHLGVTSLALCYGYSMGGMQALHWAALYPAMVQRVAATCGTASCHEYNAVFLEGLLSILGPPTPAHAADGAPQGGPLPSPNLAAFGRVYAGWGLPDSWYRKQLWRMHGGHATLDAFLRESWEKWTTNANADNMRCQLRTWRDAKLTPAQLAGITARVVYLPSPGDRYFTLPDVEAEARSIPGGLAQVVPLSMDWGHRAGDPHRAGQEADYERIRATVHALLRS